MANWQGDLLRFAAECEATDDAAALTAWFRSVPPDRWGSVDPTVSTRLHQAQFPERPVDGIVLNERRIHQQDAADAKWEAFVTERQARQAAATRPADR